MELSKEQTAARTALDRYIAENGMRRTPERYSVLEHAYAMRGHFDIDQLYETMRQGDCRVSRATVYNTIQLLVNAGLVRKHRFDNTTAQYERVSCVSMSSHHHLVCRVCGSVREMSDSDTVRAIEQRQYNGFRPDYVALYVYGLCSRCQRRLRRSDRPSAQ